LFRKLRELLEVHLRANRDAWGFVSAAWLDEQMQRSGPQTHNVQLKAAIVLRSITTNGLHLDPVRQTELLEQVGAILCGFGNISGQGGSDGALQAILGRLERRRPGREFARTPTGKFATSEEALASLADSEPFARALLSYCAVEKLRALSDPIARAEALPAGAYGVCPSIAFGR
jgi:hypothetical protein